EGREEATRARACAAASQSPCRRPPSNALHGGTVNGLTTEHGIFRVSARSCYGTEKVKEKLLSVRCRCNRWHAPGCRGRRGRRGRVAERAERAPAPRAPAMEPVRPRMIAPARAHRGDRGRGGGGPWGEEAASRSAGRGRGRLAGRHAPVSSTARTKREQFSLLPRRPARAAPNIIRAQERVNEWSAGRSTVPD